MTGFRGPRSPSHPWRNTRDNVGLTGQAVGRMDRGTAHAYKRGPHGLSHAWGRDRAERRHRGGGREVTCGEAGAAHTPGKGRWQELADQQLSS